jgi:pyrroloquinoline quinone biosynthesis protein B
VSSDGRHWALLNASPDLRQQIADTPELWPAADGPLRNSPIKAVVLTNADVDHIIGLINLREGQPFSVLASPRVMATLDANSVFNVLNREKVALFLETEGQNFGSRDGDTIGLEVSEPATGAKFYYIPGCAEVDPPLADRIRGASLVFFDGTLFTDDEMITQGLLPKTGKRMGHISMSGPDGSMAAFQALGVARRIYVHINNSNPVLDENAPERREVDAAGWDVAHDGMEVRL